MNINFRDYAINYLQSQIAFTQLSVPQCTENYYVLVYRIQNLLGQQIHLCWRSSKATRTRSGVNGIWRMRTPVASKMAFATAAAVVTVEGSPAPIAGWSGRLISTISISGTSEKVKIGYVCQSTLVMCISSNWTSSLRARLRDWITFPSI